MDRLRLARGAFVALVVATLLLAIAFSATLVASPATDAGRSFTVATAGEDYAVAWVPLVPIDHVVEAKWSLSVGNRSPDRIVIVPAEDLADLFAGRTPAHVLASATREHGGGFSGWYAPGEGWLRLRFVEQDPPLVGPMTWRYQCDGCRDDDRPAIVWIRGDAWAGAPPVGGAWGVDEDGRPTGDSPILVRAVSNEHNFVDAYDWLVGALLAGGALAAASGAWWAIESRLARRTRAAPAPPSTEELLRLVERADRYLEGLARWSLAGGLVVLVASAAILALVVPSLVAASNRHFLSASADEGAPILVAMVPFFSLCALALWMGAWARIRRERERWRGVAAGFREASERILDQP